MTHAGRLDVELLHHRKSLKSWVVKRIAATPDLSDESSAASAWFHDLPVEERSRLITDLAWLNIKGADAQAIAAGPLGDLLDRIAHLIEREEKVAVAAEVRLEERVQTAAAVEPEYAVPAWFSSWKEFEPEFEGSVGPRM